MTLLGVGQATPLASLTVLPAAGGTTNIQGGVFTVGDQGYGTPLAVGEYFGPNRGGYPIDPGQTTVCQTATILSSAAGSVTFTGAVSGIIGGHVGIEHGTRDGETAGALAFIVPSVPFAVLGKNVSLGSTVNFTGAPAVRSDRPDRAAFAGDVTLAGAGSGVRVTADADGDGDGGFVFSAPLTISADCHLVWGTGR